MFREVSVQVLFYLYKSTIGLCMKYYFHVLAGLLNCFLDLLGKQHKWVYRTFGPTHVASLELLTHGPSMISHTVCFIFFHFRRCSSALDEMVSIHLLSWRGLFILVGCMIFLSPFLDVKRMSMSTISFLLQLVHKYFTYTMFLLTQDQSCFEFRVSRHVSCVGSCWSTLLCGFPLTCDSMRFIVCSAMHVFEINEKEKTFKNL